MFVITICIIPVFCTYFIKILENWGVAVVQEANIFMVVEKAGKALVE